MICCWIADKFVQANSEKMHYELKASIPYTLTE